MKIRVLSDIHLDVNKDDFKLSGDEFTVIAGDISADVDETIRWIKENVKYGVFVEGNHILYNKKYFLEESYEKLKEAFPLNSDVSFLQNEIKVVDGITFAGCTLWTDYSLHGTQSLNMLYAERVMNDYKWRVKGVRKVSPQKILKEHIKSKEFLESVKDAVVITHHAPSKKSISEKYLYDDANCFYASHLDSLASRQKLWIHGHVHDFFDYKIDDCRVVCNPNGYNYRNENPFFDKNFMVEI